MGKSNKVFVGMDVHKDSIEGVHIRGVRPQFCARPTDFMNRLAPNINASAIRPAVVVPIFAGEFLVVLLPKFVLLDSRFHSPDGSSWPQQFKCLIDIFS